MNNYMYCSSFFLLIPLKQNKTNSFFYKCDGTSMNTIWGDWPPA